MSFLNEGLHKKDNESFAKPLIPTPLKFSGKASFVELCKEYTFYTPAALYLYGGLTFDPVSQFYKDKNLPGHPSAVLIDEAIFEGLANDTFNEMFNHFLMAIPNKYWKDMALCLGTIGVMDKDNRHYLGTEIQKLPMIDHLALKRKVSLPSTLPFVDIYTVALDGNKVCMHYLPALNPPIDKITFVKNPPREQTVKYADSIFDQLQDPEKL